MNFARLLVLLVALASSSSLIAGAAASEASCAQYTDEPTCSSHQKDEGCLWDNNCAFFQQGGKQTTGKQCSVVGTWKVTVKNGSKEKTFMSVFTKSIARSDGMPKNKIMEVEETDKLRIEVTLQTTNDDDHPCEQMDATYLAFFSDDCNTMTTFEPNEAGDNCESRRISFPPTIEDANFVVQYDRVTDGGDSGGGSATGAVIAVVVSLLIVAGAAFVFYFKVYKPKQGGGEVVGLSSYAPPSTTASQA